MGDRSRGTPRKDEPSPWRHRDLTPSESAAPRLDTYSADDLDRIFYGDDPEFEPFRDYVRTLPERYFRPPVSDDQRLILEWHWLPREVKQNIYAGFLLEHFGVVFLGEEPGPRPWDDEEDDEEIDVDAVRREMDRWRDEAERSEFREDVLFRADVPTVEAGVTPAPPEPETAPPSPAEPESPVEAQTPPNPDDWMVEDLDGWFKESFGGGAKLNELERQVKGAKLDELFRKIDQKAGGRWLSLSRGDKAQFRMLVEGWIADPSSSSNLLLRPRGGHLGALTESGEVLLFGSPEPHSPPPRPPRKSLLERITVPRAAVTLAVVGGLAYGGSQVLGSDGEVETVVATPDAGGELSGVGNQTDADADAAPISPTEPSVGAPDPDTADDLSGVGDPANSDPDAAPVSAGEPTDEDTALAEARFVFSGYDSLGGEIQAQIGLGSRASEAVASGRVEIGFTITFSDSVGTFTLNGILDSDGYAYSTKDELGQLPESISTATLVDGEILFVTLSDDRVTEPAQSVAVSIDFDFLDEQGETQFTLSDHVSEGEGPGTE